MAVERYADLSDEAKAFLSHISAENVGDIHAAFRFYGRLSEPSKRFLLNADDATFKFLEKARPEEILNLENTVRLATAGKSVGKFFTYTMGAFLGMLIFVSQFGEQIAKFFRLIKGGQ